MATPGAYLTGSIRNHTRRFDRGIRSGLISPGPTMPSRDRIQNPASPEVMAPFAAGYIQSGSRSHRPKASGMADSFGVRVRHSPSALATRSADGPTKLTVKTLDASVSRRALVVSVSHASAELGVPRETSMRPSKDLILARMLVLDVFKRSALPPGATKPPVINALGGITGS